MINLQSRFPSVILLTVENRKCIQFSVGFLASLFRYFVDLLEFDEVVYLSLEQLSGQVAMSVTPSISKLAPWDSNSISLVNGNTVTYYNYINKNSFTTPEYNQLLVVITSESIINEVKCSFQY